MDFVGRLFRRTLLLLVIAAPAGLVADGATKYTDYITSLESLQHKEFKQIFVDELHEYIRRFPDASNLDEMHFKMATFYHDAQKTEESFFYNMQFLYLYPGSQHEAAARDRLRGMVVQDKKYEKLRDRIEPLLDRQMSNSSKEVASHAFLRDMYNLQFEPIQDLLINACQAFLIAYPTAINADEVLFWRAELLAAEKKSRQALAEYLKVTYVYDKSLYVTSSKLKMAEIYTDRLDEHQKAILTLEEFLLEFPEDPQAAQAQLQIARIQEKDKKKYLEAINSYTAVAEKYPNSLEAVPALFEAARLYEDKFDEFDQAIRIYTEIVRDFPNDEKAAHAMARAAEIYEKRLKDYLNAASVYYKVYGLYPESTIAPESLYAAAEITEKELKDLDKALEYYRQLTQSYPNNKLASKAEKRIEKISREVTSKR